MVKNRPPARARKAPGQRPARKTEHHAAVLQDRTDEVMLAFVAAGAQAHWESDTEGRVVTDSPSWRAYTGQTVEEMFGYGWLDAIHPDDRAATDRQRQEAVASGGLVNVEFRLRSADGGWRWTNVRAAPLTDSKGRIRKWLGLNFDIAERKKTEEALRASERRLTEVIEGSSDGHFVRDLSQGRHLRSARTNELLGLPALDSKVGLDDWKQFAHADDIPAVEEANADLVSGTRDRAEFSVRVRMPDGAWAWRLVRTKATDRDATGRAIRLAGTVSDVHAQRTAEDALKESQRRLSVVLEGTNDGYWDWFVQSGASVVNRRWREIVGLDAAGAETTQPHETWAKRIHPNDAPLVDGAVARLLSGQSQSMDVEYRLHAADGTWKWARTKGRVVERDGAGQATRVAGTTTDITEFKNLWEQSQRRELLHRAVTASIPNAVVALLDKDLRFVLVTGGGLAALGLTGEDLEAKTAAEFAPDTAAVIEPALRAAFQGLTRRTELNFGGRAYAVHSGPVREADGSVFHIVAAAIDVTELKAAEDALHATLQERGAALAALGRSELLYRAIARHFPNGVLALFDKDLRFLVADGAKPVLTPDPASFQGRTLFDVAPPDVLAHMEPAFRLALRGEPGHARYEAGGRRVELITHPVRDERGEVIMGLAMTQDVTDREALEAQFAVSSRLAAMGTLVAGVAHEINNPLAGELASQGLALDALRELREHLRSGQGGDSDALGRRLDEILELVGDARQGAERIRRIVKDLTLFGRPDPKRNRIRLIDVANSALRWVRAGADRRASVQVEVAGAPEVRASAGQLEQVVVNLVNNAADAIPEGTRGVITIKVGPGGPGMARLDVTDSGTGIDPKVMERVFDPFFTTRQVGKGMGLGLPICHAIVTAHGGTLTAMSTPGKGSTFRVELPVAADA
jgi:PAS domain S-box-containing protein